MTRDEVIAMATEAGLLEPGYQHGDTVLSELERFAALVATAEREACAIACEVHAAAVINDGKQSAFAIAHECASAIRARGSTIPL